MFFTRRRLMRLVAPCISLPTWRLDATHTHTHTHFLPTWRCYATDTHTHIHAGIPLYIRESQTSRPFAQACTHNTHTHMHTRTHTHTRARARTHTHTHRWDAAPRAPQTCCQMEGTCSYQRVRVRAGHVLCLDARSLRTCRKHPL
jgi:hypothetical protein